MASRRLSLLVLAASCAAQQLSRRPQLRFGPSATLSASCAGDEHSYVKYISPRKLSAVVSGHGIYPSTVRARLMNVPHTCLDSSIDEPCASNYEPEHPKLWACKWAAAAQAAEEETTALAANTTILEDARGNLLGYQVFLDCPAPTRSFLGRIYTGENAEDIAIRLSVLYRGRLIPFSGVDDGDVSTLTVYRSGVEKIGAGYCSTYAEGDAGQISAAHPDDENGDGRLYPSEVGLTNGDIHSEVFLLRCAAFCTSHSGLSHTFFWNYFPPTDPSEWSCGCCGPKATGAIDDEEASEQNDYFRIASAYQPPAAPPASSVQVQLIGDGYCTSYSTGDVNMQAAAHTFDGSGNGRLEPSEVGMTNDDIDAPAFLKQCATFCRSHSGNSHDFFWNYFPPASPASWCCGCCAPEATSALEESSDQNHYYRMVD